MTGPDLPRPVSGSNAIGSFVIGVSPIGDIPTFDVWTTIISQYANSDILTGIIEGFASFIDQTKNLADFFDLLWNVDTAQGYGLDVWGRIVGINRVIKVPVGGWFGFDEAGDALTFGQGPFYGGASLTENFALDDKSYRTLIFAKALANISANTIPAINQMLLNLFPNRGNCYVTEGQVGDPYFGFSESTTGFGFDQAPFYGGQPLPENMTMTYTFEFALSPVELAIVQQSGVLPKPTGVKATVVQKV